MTSDEQGYNGWKNYPTWNVNLWLGNDAGLYSATLELVEMAVRGVEPDRARGYVADSVKAWVCDELVPDLGASFAADLLGFALDQVDWFAIADAWLEQVSELEASAR